MASNASDFFTAMAGRYDAHIRLGHPYYDEMLAELARTLPDSASRILELGGGTGALAAFLAERFPDAELTLVDASTAMLDVARERLAGASGVTYVAETFERLVLPPAQFDLVTSNMSLHHVVDKGTFYARLRDWLQPGGWLVFGDELTGAVPYVEKLHWSDWESFARLPGHWSEADLAAGHQHYLDYDRYETLARQLELLAGAGFQPIDCAWRHSNYAIFVAQA